MTIAVNSHFPDVYLWSYLSQISFQTHVYGHSCHRSVSRHLCMAISCHMSVSRHLFMAISFHRPVSRHLSMAISCFQTPLHSHSCQRPVSRHLFMDIALFGQFPDTNLLPYLPSASFQAHIHNCHWPDSRHLSMAIAVTDQFLETYPWP
jgi:hypothetical protein